MLALSSSAILSAPAQLQPEALNTTSDLALHSKDGEYGLTEHDLVFHIGANKAGTTSMWLFYSDLPGKWNPCHDMCGPKNKRWTDVSKNHKKDDAVWKHRVFMDNGDQADFEWLYEAFPKARFVQNTRGLLDWVVSRYDMVREIRLAGGCSAHGKHESCKGGWYKECAPQAIFPGHHTCLRSWLDWTGNSAEDIRGWVIGLAHVQNKQLEFFGKGTGRENRFVQADFTDDSRQHDALQRLWWINRKNLDEHKAHHMMTMDRELPTRPPVKELPGPNKIPHMLSDPHPASSKEHVMKILKEAGCHESTFDDRLYHKCAHEMESRSLSFVEMPTDRPFPSAHHWFIHKDEIDVDTMVNGTIKWADDEIVPNQSPSASV